MKGKKEKVVTQVTAFFLPLMGHLYAEICASQWPKSVAFVVLVLLLSKTTRAEHDRPTRARLSSKNSLRVGYWVAKRELSVVACGWVKGQRGAWAGGRPQELKSVV